MYGKIDSFYSHKMRFYSRTLSMSNSHRIFSTHTRIPDASMIVPNV